MKYCSQCGASVEESAGFCSGCGTSLSSVASKSAGFWKGVAASIVGVMVVVGILWAAMGSNSADPGRGKPVASASELEVAEHEVAEHEVAEHEVAEHEVVEHEVVEHVVAEHEVAGAGGASEDVVIETPGFVGRLLGEKPRVFLTISEGESLELELRELISTETASAGDRFAAVLTKPVLVEGREALPQGTVVSGHVAHAERSDKVKGRATLTLEFDSLMVSSGEEHHLDAEPLRFEARSTRKDDAVKIGGASGVGAVVGGILGGRKGAAIGAGVGAGAGTGVVLTSRGVEVVLESGTQLGAVLMSDITVELVEDDES